ncbi:MAG TPA: amino acid ABC transporter substrate-binding protein, partial [Rhizobacter sp.]|nr:amino acid ABC transporter substrate-binding protein [Rhizobacter sp.]
MQRYTPARLGRRLSLSAALFSCLAFGTIAPAHAVSSLDKAKESGQLAMGYLTDAGPFATADASGKPSGYAIELCNRIADAVKAELKLGALDVSYVALSRDAAFTAVQQGKVDLLCGAVPTLARRTQVDFSIPVMVSGVGIAVRADAPARLRQALSGADPGSRATWRGSTDQAPQRSTIGVAGGAALEKALEDRLKERRIVAEVVQVDGVAGGMQALVDGRIDALVGDHAALLAASAKAGKAGPQVMEERRAFVSLAVRRDDDDFRLLVDRTLSRLYRSPEIGALYGKYFRPP